MRGLFNCFFTLLLVVGLFASSTVATRKHSRSTSSATTASTLLLSLHPGTNSYWLALSASDTSVTEVAIKDSVSSLWTPLSSTNWGYWIFTPTGDELTFPVSVSLTSPAGTLVFDNVFDAIDAGATYNTQTSFPTEAPTLAPPSNPSVAATSYASVGAVDIVQATVNPWPGGSQYSVSIVNHDASALTGAAIAVQSGNVVNLWGIDYLDGTYILPSYVKQNGGIAPGSSFDFGYITDNSSPASFVVVSSTFAGSSATPTTAPATTDPAPTAEPATEPAATEPATAEPTTAPTTPATTKPAKTTKPPATKKPTTPPTTKAPTTKAPTTKAPTKAPTAAPTTKAPTTPATSAPTTATPTTKAPTTAAATTKAPTTAAPTTKAPTTAAATTKAPTTAAATTKAASGTPVTISGNPFTGATMYTPPYYAAQVQATVNANPSVSGLSTLANTPVAFWIDNIAKITSLPGVLAGARAQQTTSGKPSVVSIVVYDLPNRDCAALASNGEIACADATCSAGIARYKSAYVDAIITILKQYPDVRVAAIVEPDSLPNLVTNLGVPKCTTAATAYKTCVAYAIQQLATLPNVASYVDAAHGGWLGWTANLAGMASIFSEVLALAGGNNKIRGFTTNVANYQPLGTLTATADPCGLVAQWNFAINEVAYTNLLSAALSTAGITGKTFVIDTSRNGVINARSSCQNWCNINKAGLGVRPIANPTGLGVTNIDALLWVKPPGESDGTSDATATRYDAHCGSPDSVTPAPEAGTWFPSYFLMAAQNAAPAL